MKNVFEEIYKIVKLIPKGKVMTYGDIAKCLGNVRLSQVVGYALHSNPYFGDVPCHRVVNRFGGLAPNFAFGKINAQKQMLENEGIVVKKDNTVDLEKYRYTIN